MSQATILVVEDNFDHAALTQAVFATGLANVPVHVAFSGEEARSYLIGEWPYDHRDTGIRFPRSSCWTSGCLT